MPSSHPIPTRQFRVIEFPGNIQNPEKAIELLGGIDSIEKSFTIQQQMELQLCGSPIAHPIFGDVVSTGNLLLKTTRRRRKNTQEWHYSHEIIGIVEKTCRFRSLADFQYLPNDPMVDLFKDLKNWNVQAIEGFRFSTDKGNVQNLRNMPPPSFSRALWPVEYKYKQHSAARYLESGENGEAEITFSTYRRLHCISLSAADKSPASPTPEILAQIPENSEHMITELQKAFEKRPVYLRTVLLNSISAETRKSIKYLLPSVAYHFSSGPFKDCWVKYGCDPRSDPQYRIYQAVDARIRNFYSNTAHRSAGGTKSISTAQNATPGNTENFNNERILTGSNFQLCDNNHPSISKIIQNPKTIQSEFHPKYGWFSSEAILNIRKISRNENNVDSDYELDERDHEILQEILNDGINSGDFANKMNVCGESESQSQSKPVKVPKKRATIHSRLEEALQEDIRQRVSSQVDELMKNLQHGDLLLNDDENSALQMLGADGEDVGYFDIYDDSDSESDNEV